MLARYGTSFLVACGVTFGLFFLMQILVSMGDTELSDFESFSISDMIRVPKEATLDRIERNAEKPPEPEAPPPEVDIPKTASLNAQTGLNMNMAGVNVDINIGGVGVGAPGDGDYLPIRVTPPQYPRRAQERGIEGYVIVEFTVTDLGTTEGCMIVEAEPKGYFDRSACRAASTYKYKPKTVNGEPVPVSGVQYMITYQLEDG